MSNILDITGGCESVEVPSEGADAEKVIYSTPSPVRLVFTKAPVPKYEGVPLRTQPKVQAVNVNVSIYYWFKLIYFTSIEKQIHKLILITLDDCFLVVINQYSCPLCGL